MTRARTSARSEEDLRLARDIAAEAAAHNNLVFDETAGLAGEPDSLRMPGRYLVIGRMHAFHARASVCETTADLARLLVSVHFEPWGHLETWDLEEARSLDIILEHRVVQRGLEEPEGSPSQRLNGLGRRLEQIIQNAATLGLTRPPARVEIASTVYSLISAEGHLPHVAVTDAGTFVMPTPEISIPNLVVSQQRRLAGLFHLEQVEPLRSSALTCVVRCSGASWSHHFTLTASATVLDRVEEST